MRPGSTASSTASSTAGSTASDFSFHDRDAPGPAAQSVMTAAILLTAAVLQPAVLSAAGTTHQGVSREGPVAGQKSQSVSCTLNKRSNFFFFLPKTSATLWQRRQPAVCWIQMQTECHVPRLADPNVPYYYVGHLLVEHTPVHVSIFS